MSTEKVLVNDSLQELGASGFEIAKGEPDIRGWKVISSLNQDIGKVKELLFDVKHLKVRYVILNLDGKPINLLSRNIIIPVGLAELDEKDKKVFLPDITVGHLASLPEYQKGKITFNTERSIRDVFIPQSSAAAEKLADIESQENPEREAFYNNDYFDESRMYTRRRNETKAGIVENNNDKIDSKRYVRSKGDDEESAEYKTVQDEVIYIPDEKDPNLLRRTRIIREAPGNKEL